MSLKQTVKDSLWNYASPVPHMARNENWAPVAFYGASRPTLENVARNYYSDMINKILGSTDNQYLINLLNQARIRNQEQQRLNQMRYGEYPMYPLDWDNTNLPAPQYQQPVNYDL